MARPFRKLVGLVVDDGSLAAAILIWVALIWAARALLGIDPDAAAVALFVGLAAALIENVVRRARQ